MNKHAELFENGKWERVTCGSGGGCTTWVMNVPGGWLFRVIDTSESETFTTTTCFVPFPREEK